MREQLEEFSYPQAVIDEMVAEEAASSTCEIHPDNVMAVQLFIALRTQWRVCSGMAGAVMLGIEYASVSVVMRLMGIKAADRATLFTDLQTMESAALSVMREKASEESDG